MMYRWIVFFFILGTGFCPAQNNTLIINAGFGGGTYTTGDSVFVLANPAPVGFVFSKWLTNTALSDTFCVATKVKALDTDAVLSPVFIPAPVWNSNHEVINGSNVYSYFPASPGQLRGLILFFHGSNGNAGSWFNKVENRIFLNTAVEHGYAVMATESVDRITGGSQPWQWNNALTINGNPDILNINHILDTFKTRGWINTDTRLFGVGFSQGSGFCSIIAALKNFSANNLGATPGINAVIAQTLSPTYWMASRQDENADPQRLNKCISNYNTLVSRGISAELHIHEPFPVTPNRFWRIPGVDSLSSVDIYNRLKINGYLDNQNFINFNPDAQTGWKSVMQPTYNAVLNDIEDQVIICYTEHKFHSDQVHYILQFFDLFAKPVTTDATAFHSTSFPYTVVPNPFADHISLLPPLKTEYVVLYDAQGRTIFMGKNIDLQDFTALNKGFYVLQIFNENGAHLQTIQLIKP